MICVILFILDSCNENEVLFKYSRLSITSLFNKSNFDFFITLREFINYFQHLYNSVIDMNSQNKFTYNVYTLKLNKNCPIPFNIMYSFLDTDDIDLDNECCNYIMLNQFIITLY